jgi:hypothetical protein
MGGIAELHCIGINLVKDRCLAQIFCLKPKRTSEWFERIEKQSSPDSEAMLTPDEGNSVLK